MALASQPISLPARRTLRLFAPAEWWHLLSLDAPTVAALWAWSFAHALHVALSADSLLLLFAGTWLLYVADRILDGYHQDRTRLRERHLFYLRHRAAAIAAAVPVAIFLIWLVAVHMLPRARHADILLFALAAAYFALVHLRGRAIERWFPKELLVALIAAAAIAVPAWSRFTPHLEQSPADAALAIFTILFAALCWLNCIAIEKWEQPLDKRLTAAAYSPRGWSSQAQVSDRTTQWGQQHLRRIGAVIASAAVAAATFFLYLNQLPAAALCLSGALAAALLAGLDQAHSRTRVSAFHLRVAADAALLTPLLALLIR